MNSDILKVKAEIASSVSHIARGLRQFVKNSAPGWARVPKLALEADGRRGYSQAFSMAYRHGFWDVDRLTLFVDLLNGELVTFRQIGTSEPMPATDEYVAAFADRIDLLDAAQVVAGLQDQAMAPYSATYSAKKQREWRENISRELGGLGDIYKRENRKSYPRFDVIF